MTSLPEQPVTAPHLSPDVPVEPAVGPAVPPDEDRPPDWLFQPGSLGAGFRVYVPTVVLARACGFARVLVVGFLVVKAEYGLQRLALQLINILAAVARMGVSAGLERYAPVYEHRRQLRHFLRRGLWWGAVLAGLLVLLLAIAAPAVARVAFEGAELEPAPGEPPAAPGYLLRITAACLAVALALVIYFNLHGVLRGLRMYRALALLELSHGVTFLLFSLVGLVLAGHVSWTGQMLPGQPGAALVLTMAYGLSLVLPAAGVGAALGGYMRRWREQAGRLAEPAHRSVAELMKFSTFVTGANIVWTVFTMFGLWYLNRRHGRDQAGLYAFPRDLLQVVQILAMAIWPVAQNSACRLWAQGDRDRAIGQLALVFRVTGWLFWLGCAGVVLARTQVVRLLPAAYGDAASLLPWLLLAYLWLVHLSLPTAQAFLLENSRALFFSASLGLAVHALTARHLVVTGAALGTAQSAALGIAAALLTLHTVVWITAGRRAWLGLRELVLLLAPGLLVLPVVWPIVGEYLLAAAVLLACLGLLLTGWLWRREDLRILRNYVASTVRMLVGRRPAG